MSDACERKTHPRTIAIIKCKIISTSLSLSANVLRDAYSELLYGIYLYTKCIRVYLYIIRSRSICEFHSNIFPFQFGMRYKPWLYICVCLCTYSISMCVYVCMYNIQHMYKRWYTNEYAGMLCLHDLYDATIAEMIVFINCDFSAELFAACSLAVGFNYYLHALAAPSRCGWVSYTHIYIMVLYTKGRIIYINVYIYVQ